MKKVMMFLAGIMADFFGGEVGDGSSADSLFFTGCTKSVANAALFYLSVKDDII
ncbi:MAG: hypothetical protein H6Q58_2259 [Firmicutes bacterium]|nr:hypothetical protein [Bacillota bacterium]